MKIHYATEIDATTISCFALIVAIAINRHTDMIYDDNDDDNENDYDDVDG